MGPGLRAPLPTGFKVFDRGRSRVRKRDSPTLPNPSQNLTLHDVPELTPEPQVNSDRRKRARIGNAVVALGAEDPLPESVSLSKDVESRVNVGSSSNQVLDKHSNDDSSLELGGSIGRPVPKPAYIVKNYDRTTGSVFVRSESLQGLTGSKHVYNPVCHDPKTHTLAQTVNRLTSISLETELGVPVAVNQTVRSNGLGLGVDINTVDPDPTPHNDSRVTTATLLPSTVHRVEGEERSHGGVIRDTTEALDPDPIAETRGTAFMARGREANAAVDSEVRKTPSRDRWVQVREGVKRILKTFRSQHTVEKAKVNFTEAMLLPAYNLIENATGGCLDSIAGGITGFRHTGGTENVSTSIGRLKGRLFEDLTQAKCWGDTRLYKEWGPKVLAIFKVLHYFKAGQPCPDYSSLGSQLGSDGKKGGDLFLIQISEILFLKPITFRLEMVDSALKVHDGRELREVFDRLKGDYRIGARVVKVWEYGDPSARQRIIIIGGRRDSIPADVPFIWPDKLFNSEVYPIARDIAIPDDGPDGVPPDYWRDDPIRTYDTIDLEPEAGEIQYIGEAEDSIPKVRGVASGANDRLRSAGHSSKPRNISGWDGNYPTTMGTNGGSRRPPLSWKPGEPIGRTRVGVITESLRAASLDENSYLKWGKRFYSQQDTNMSLDQWLRELVNLGVPLCTSVALDRSIADWLSRAGVKPVVPDTRENQNLVFDKATNAKGAWVKPKATPNLDSLRWKGKQWHHDPKHTIDSEHLDLVPVYDVNKSSIGTALLSDKVQTFLQLGVGDSGASDNLFKSAAANSSLTNTRRSNVRYSQAEEGAGIRGDLIGDMTITILNLSEQKQCPPSVDHTFSVTTVENLGSPLISLEAFFRDQGYDIHLSHGYQPGDFTGMHRPSGTKHGEESYIPLVYNWEGQGGWRLPFVIRDPSASDAEHQNKVISLLRQCSAKVSQPVEAPEYNAALTQKLGAYYWACPAVEQQLTVRVESERDIRPAFSYGGLRRIKESGFHRKHCEWAHTGESKSPCKVCDMFKGVTRPKSRHTTGRPRERRPGHTWYMDMITFKYRSEEGCKHLTVLTDARTSALMLIPLYWKNDITHEIKRWIKAMRSHPAFANHTDYAIVSVIITDNDSVWSEHCKEFQAMLESVGNVRWESDFIVPSASRINSDGVEGVVVEANPRVRDVIPEMIYVAPEDHARENARAEGANKIVEAAICSLLYENNLPPSWWQRAANDVMFLLGRFPVLGLDAAYPIDGDRALPLEELFMGYYSRNQLYRELNCYVAVGTPALCRSSRPGSSLEPKVRWGIAIGQRGKVTRWMCPFLLSRFKNRTFSAYTLQSGMNYAQFLGLDEIAPSAQSQTLAGDMQEIEGREKWILELPKPRENTLALPAPIKELIEVFNADDTLGSIRAEAQDIGKDLCEFFPRLVRRGKNPKSPLGVPSDDPEVDSDGEGSDSEPTRGITVVDHRGQPLAIGPPDEGDPDVEDDTNADRTTHIEGWTQAGLDALDGINPEDKRVKPTKRIRSRLDDPDPDPVRLGHSKRRRRNPLNPASADARVKKRKAVSQPTPDPSGGKTVKRKAVREEGKARPNVSDKERITELEMDSNLYVQADEVFEPTVIGPTLLTGWDKETEIVLEDLEARQHLKYGVTTDGDQSWGKICKQLHTHIKGIPPERQNLYRLWLLTKPVRDGEERIYVEDLPKKVCNSRQPLTAGLFLPHPSGPHWTRLLQDKSYRERVGEPIAQEEIDEETAYVAMHALECDIRKGAPTLRTACLALLAGTIQTDDLDEIFENITSEMADSVFSGEQSSGTAYAVKRMKEHLKVQGSSTEQPPRSVIEALLSDNWEEWLVSILSEMRGLDDQGVFSHDWTLADLRQSGIRGKPVPCSTCLTHKFKDGFLDRLKTRICIAGHQGNVTKGIHYHDVFSPSPNQHTERLLQAMMVIYHLYNLAWDIKQAYTWAPMPAGERIAVVYPDGFKRYGPIDSNGERHELYMVLEKNLYGMPSAGRGWGLHRDKTINRLFNSEELGWQCRKMTNDPCLFRIDRKVDPSKRRDRDPRHRIIPGQAHDDIKASLELPDDIERSFILIHTDDCDAYGTSLEVLNEINYILNEEWKTEIIDRSYILGVKRTVVTDDPKGWHCTLTMDAYIEEMVLMFDNELTAEFGTGSRRRKRTPFPDAELLTKSIKPLDGEVDRNLKRGYQRLVGCLLWCVRHVAPAAAYGCSQLCKLMSAPTDLAWKCGLHLLAYLATRSTRGIRFSETDSSIISYVDASNKDDPVDGKCQYGFNILWGGPLITKSSKLGHVGLNSTYNEYMALTHCIKHLAWLRKLMIELGLGHACAKPITILADNKQANTLCSEDLVTSGNMYFRTCYHYNKEEVAAGHVEVKWIPTALNIADTNTKALGPVKLDYFEPSITGYDRRCYEVRDGRWDEDYCG